MKLLAKTLPVLLLAACGTALTADDVTKSLSDATSCAFGVIAVSTGTVNVQQLLACGLTVGDALAIVKKLRAQATPTEAGAAVSPERIAYAKKLDQAISDLERLQVK